MSATKPKISTPSSPSSRPSPPSSTARASRRIQFADSVFAQKEPGYGCASGKTAQFNKNEINVTQYLANINKPGMFGCGPGVYAKYSNGKYCCSKMPSSSQELFDYTNLMLGAAMTNVGASEFKKIISLVDYLILMRNHLKKKHPALQETIDLPHGVESVQQWYNSMTSEAARVAADREDRVVRTQPRARVTLPPPPPSTGGTRTRKRRHSAHKRTRRRMTRKRTRRAK